MTEWQCAGQGHMGGACTNQRKPHAVLCFITPSVPGKSVTANQDTGVQPPTLMESLTCAHRSVGGTVCIYVIVICNVKKQMRQIKAPEWVSLRPLATRPVLQRGVTPPAPRPTADTAH